MKDQLEKFARRLDNLVGDMSNLINGADSPATEEQREQLDKIAGILSGAFHELELMLN